MRFANWDLGFESWFWLIEGQTCRELFLCALFATLPRDAAPPYQVRHRGIEGFLKCSYVTIKGAAAGGGDGAGARTVEAGGGAAGGGAAGGGAAHGHRFRPCKFQSKCSKESCSYHHFSPAGGYQKPAGIADDAFKSGKCKHASCPTAGSHCCLPVVLPCVITISGVSTRVTDV